MRSRARTSPKAGNSTWIVSLLVLDITVLVLIVDPGLLTGVSLTQITVIRAALLFLLPVVALLGVSVLSHRIKEMLVYWRFVNVLPGHQAFSKLAPRDSRIDMDALRKNVGKFPVEPEKQDALWYKLYRRVEDKPSVQDALRMYLLFRDATAISFVLAISLSCALWAFGLGERAAWLCLTVLGGQFFLTSVAARQNGKRLICNVLAIHATQRVPAPK